MYLILFAAHTTAVHSTAHLHTGADLKSPVLSVVVCCQVPWMNHYCSRPYDLAWINRGWTLQVCHQP
jgi:hypothetical protein